MTGMEAWSLVAPIINAHSVFSGKLNALDEAYVIVYQALKELDENHKGEENEQSSGLQQRN